MAGSLIDSSKTSQRKPKRRPSSSVDLDAKSKELKPQPTAEQISLQKRSMALDLLQRGKSRREVANQMHMTEAEVFRLEEDYYSGLESLSEHSMLMKQIGRLEAILDAIWDQLLDPHTEIDAKVLQAGLTLIDQVSELAGLKKTKIEAEVKLIQQQQVPVIALFTETVVDQVLGNVENLLPQAKKAELEAKKDDWVAQATLEASTILSEPTATMRM